MRAVPPALTGGVPDAPHVPVLRRDAAEIASLREDVEWFTCPVCEYGWAGHAPDCRLAAFLKGA